MQRPFEHISDCVLDYMLEAYITCVDSDESKSYKEDEAIVADIGHIVIEQLRRMNPEKDS